MTRAQTLILALLVLHLLLGLLCLAISRGEHKSPALRWWGLGLVVYSVGLLTTVAGAFGLPQAGASTAGNTLIALSSVLCVRGVLSHTPVRLSPPWVGAGLLATVAVLIASNATGYEQLLVNVTGPTVFAVVLFLLAAALIVRRGPRDARHASRFLAVMLVFAVVTWILRIVALLAVLGLDRARERVDLVMSLFAIAQMVNGVAATLSLVWIDVRLMQAELSRVAHTDALTGLPNRRAIRLRFGEEAARAARTARKFTMALLDIDHFKQVNDRHGHATGDEVLKAVADALAGAKRGEARTPSCPPRETGHRPADQAPLQHPWLASETWSFGNPEDVVTQIDVNGGRTLGHNFTDDPLPVLENHGLEFAGVAAPAFAADVKHNAAVTHKQRRTKCHPPSTDAFPLQSIGLTPIVIIASILSTQPAHDYTPTTTTGFVCLSSLDLLHFQESRNPH